MRPWLAFFRGDRTTFEKLGRKDRRGEGEGLTAEAAGALCSSAEGRGSEEEVQGGTASRSLVGDVGWDLLGELVADPFEGSR